MTLSDLWYRIKRNPVIVVFFSIAVIEAVVAEAVTWRQPTLVVLGLVTRLFTAPEFEVAQREDEAFIDGTQIKEWF